MELVAGEELDRRVAEAIGLETCLCGPAERGYSPKTGMCLRCALTPAKRYSTDLNAAFTAAEKVGLWNSHLIAKDGDNWEAWRHEHFAANMYGRDGEVFAGPFPTPALAICAAILKLKGE